MTRFVTPAHVSRERQAMHDQLADLCRAFKARGGRTTGKRHHKRYLELREAFGSGEE